MGRFPLTVGENPITVVARDTHGNTTTKSIMVYRADPAAARILAVGGSGQTGTVHRRMPTPIEVEVRDASNQPWPGKVVRFTVIRSDGRLAPAAAHPTAGELIFQAITDATGRAKAWWVLGSDAGCGNNRVEVTTDGIPGSAFFCASANPGPASQINIGSGNTQTGEVNAFAREPLRIWVSDSCNGIQGVNVTLRVTRGGSLRDDADNCRVWLRDGDYPSDWYYFMGFRPARAHPWRRDMPRPRRSRRPTRPGRKLPGKPRWPARCW